MHIEDLFEHSEGGSKKSTQSPLKSLETDLILYSDTLKEIALEILNSSISNYPIFIAHQHEVNVGEVVIHKDEMDTSWNVHASTLEDFIAKKIIFSDKEDVFKQNYKDPKQFMCLFVIVPEGANFVFYPYK